MRTEAGHGQKFIQAQDSSHRARPRAITHPHGNVPTHTCHMHACMHAPLALPAFVVANAPFGVATPLRSAPPAHAPQRRAAGRGCSCCQRPPRSAAGLCSGPCTVGVGGGGRGGVGGRGAGSALGAARRSMLTRRGGLRRPWITASLAVRVFACTTAMQPTEGCLPRPCLTPT